MLVQMDVKMELVFNQIKHAQILMVERIMRLKELVVVKMVFLKIDVLVIAGEMQ